MLAKHLSSDSSYPRIVHAAASRHDESHERVKLIRKLRWIGLDQEAKQIEQALRGLSPERRGSVLAGPDSTD
jgi:hypothetical protein